MTASEKKTTAITLSVLALLGVGGYLLYEEYKKRKAAKYKQNEIQNTVKTTTNTVVDEIGKQITNTKVAAPAVASKYGLKPGDKLWAKGDFAHLYSYPNTDKKNYIGYVVKQAKPTVFYVSDANTPGFIKVNATYKAAVGSKQTTSPAYMQVSQVTNVAP